VKHFLEQCLCSVRKAIARPGLSAEVIVVDNDSRDHSLEYLQRFSSCVRFVANSTNQGFAKACNQGVRLSTGRFILFLNPDTILPEDCLEKCLAFFSNHPGADAIGIRMLDGQGNFLKESKRSFPSPRTSLFKLFGLARIFPTSKTFSKYHLGNLREDQDHEVDVLAGAFMMVRKEVLDKVGLFDETFFMYGEDVDLSYRIQQAGYKNYYFAGSSILHFKGESTRKGSLNYIRMFYKAMSVFVKKHYGGSKAGIFNLLIQVAIWTRAAMSAAGRFTRWIGLPVIDAVLIFFSFLVMEKIWSSYIRTDIHYPEKLLWVAFPSFTIIYLLVAYYAGLYDRSYRRSGLLRSTLIATLVLLASYALLPERFRFSRAVVLFGAMIAFVLISLSRWLLIQLNVLKKGKEKLATAHTLIVGSEAEYDTARQLLREAGMEEIILGRVATDPADHAAIGYWKNLKGLNALLPYKEVIFCEGTISFHDMIDAVQQLPAGTRVKFHASKSNSIVGSDSKDSSGESLSKENAYKLANPYNLRVKRLIDFSVSLLFLLTFPLHFLFVKKPLYFLSNCFRVIAGKQTWIGYIINGKPLPNLQQSVLGPNGLPAGSRQELAIENLRLLDEWYARDYEPLQDLKLIFKNYKSLGG
jgi:GT2 family glycosyltransferase